MDSNLNNTKNNDSSLNSFEDIDFEIIFNFFNRNKIFISSISIVFIFLGILYSFFPKRTWQGQFQIVLSTGRGSQKNPKINSFSKSFNSLVGGNYNDLQTEVGILRSPSVLMPAFKVARGNSDQFSNNYDQFSSWKKKYLNIELQQKTSILNITYKDTNKSIILPVLKKMSSSYQDYSGKRKKRIDENTESYLKKQINYFKEKSAESLKKAQGFAIDQDLIYFDINQKQVLSLSNDNAINSNIDISSASFLPQNINIENVRVSAANQIRKIDMQLEKITSFKEGEELQSVGSMIPTLNRDKSSLDTPLIIKEIEAELIELRSKYKEDDVKIKRLLEKRKLAVDMLNTRAINFLKAKRLENKARMDAAYRPKEVLLKYKELIRDASRDEFTLIGLENELRLTELGKTRKEPIWELITVPALSTDPVHNLTRDSILISLFLGALLGTLYCFIKEKKSGKIFEYKDLKKLIGLELGQIFKYKFNELNQANNTFLNEYIKKKFNKGINLIKLGNLEENKTQIIKEDLTKNKIKIDIFESILELQNSGNTNANFLILEFEFFTFTQVESLKKYLELFDIDLAGTIFIEKN